MPNAAALRCIQVWLAHSSQGRLRLLNFKRCSWGLSASGNFKRCSWYCAFAWRGSDSRGSQVCRSGHTKDILCEGGRFQPRPRDAPLSLWGLQAQKRPPTNSGWGRDLEAERGCVYAIYYMGKMGPICRFFPCSAWQHLGTQLSSPSFC